MGFRGGGASMRREMKKEEGGVAWRREMALETGLGWEDGGKRGPRWGRGELRSGSERPSHIRPRLSGENREGRGGLGQREKQAQRGDKKEAETRQRWRLGGQV